MDGAAQMAWISSAIDALEGINGFEVHAISAELRRSVTRPAQIVPEIARLVAMKRARSTNITDPQLALNEAERRISAEAQKRKAESRDQRDVEDAAAWERAERIRSGLHVDPLPPPLTRDELDNLPDHVARLGLKGGFLESRGGKLHEVQL